jgi:hypothetical protein
MACIQGNELAPFERSNVISSKVWLSGRAKFMEDHLSQTSWKQSKRMIQLACQFDPKAILFQQNRLSLLSGTRIKANI